MNDSPPPEHAPATTTVCGWTKLFHPRGPLVTLPLPADPAAALAAVTAALDAGFLAQAPGLEEGEEKEQIGWVLKSVHSNEGRETPFVLLYSANEALTWSILKVYLNTDQDAAAFEHASRMKLADLPEYVGQDKPQRSANGRTDKFIIPAPRPFGVVFRKNPKHDATEAGKMKPARLFVRWADVAPAAQEGQADPNETIVASAVEEIMSLLPAAGLTSAENQDRLLKWVGEMQGGKVEKLEDIRVSSLPKVMKHLRDRVARRQAKEGASA
jgi:hypothetical protein